MKIVKVILVPLLLAFIFDGGLLSGELPAEQQLLAVLQSEATLQQKDAACAHLKLVGTAHSVPVLTSLLTDPKLSHSARYALESMPIPEAGAALIASLDKTNGLLKAGIIGSLGQRHETAAIPRLASLLKDSDPDIAAAAASALGRLSGPVAIQALLAAIPAKSENTPLAVWDGLLAAANLMLTEGKKATACQFFDKIFRMPAPSHVRAGAYRSLIAGSDYTRALELVKTGLQGNDGPSQLASLEMARTLKNPSVTATLCGLLGKTPLAVQAALIETLHQLGDTAAVPALLEMSHHADPALRITAIAALGELADAKAVPLLLKRACSPDEQEKRTARQALLLLHNGEVAAALTSQVAAGDPSVQMEAARALAGRGDKEAVPELIALAKSQSGAAHRAACMTLGRLADPSQIRLMVQLVVAAENETARTEARDALAAVCQRFQGQGVKVDAQPVIAGLSTGNTQSRGALLIAASTLTDERIREALRLSLNSQDKRLRDDALIALEQTHDRELLPDLLQLAEKGSDAGTQIKLLRSYIRLAMDSSAAPLSGAQSVQSLQQAMPLVTRKEEKWLILAGLAKMPSPETLEFALTMLPDPATQGEAAPACMKIAATLMSAHDGLARTAFEKIMATVQNPDQQREVKQLIQQLPGNRKASMPVTFRRNKLDSAFRSEGVCVADFNRDGWPDIATGNILYLGPDWKPQPMLTAAKEYNPKEYSNEFYCFISDVDGDGWLDLVVVGFPGAQTRWLRNPRVAGGPWTEFLAIEKTGNESPDWVDVDRDGQKELVFISENGMAFAKPGKDPRLPWRILVIAGPNDPTPGHGLGIGDINGDERLDVLCPQGWWEAPADPAQVPWTFHAARLGFEAAAQMPVFDVDGDGLNDVLSSGAHRYGLWWYEQTRQQGWLAHEIDRTISQMHALHVADLNRDGLPDLVSGKRFWAHREGDDGIDDPAMLVWYELVRKEGKPVWIRHDIDSDSGVGLHVAITDVNNDGLLDIVTSSKKGVYLFLQEKGTAAK
jgi:HEAT repeat protein